VDDSSKFLFLNFYDPGASPPPRSPCVPVWAHFLFAYLFTTMVRRQQRTIFGHFSTVDVNKTISGKAIKECPYTIVWIRCGYSTSATLAPATWQICHMITLPTAISSGFNSVITMISYPQVHSLQYIPVYQVMIREVHTSYPLNFHSTVCGDLWL